MPGRSLNAEGIVGVYNVRDHGATGDGLTGDTTGIIAAINAASGVSGAVYFPPGTYLVTSKLPIPSGVCFVGSGEAASTIKASPTLGAPIFQTVVAAGENIKDVLWRDLTLDGNTGPTGTIDCINIDTSASISTSAQNIKIQRVKFLNAHTGLNWSSNNANSQNQENNIRVIDGYAKNCAVGVLGGGAYGLKVLNCYFKACTIAAVGTTGWKGCPTNNGTGNDALYEIGNCHIEGVPNNGSGFGTESGILINCTMFNIHDTMIQYCSAYGIYAGTKEPIGSQINSVQIFGPGTAGNVGTTGGAGIRVSAIAGSPVEGGLISNVIMDNVGMGKLFGGAVGVDQGTWHLSHIYVANSASDKPAHALEVNNGNSGHPTNLVIDDFYCPNTSGAWFQVDSQPSLLTYQITNSAGYNPVGKFTSQPTVPASTVAYTNTLGTHATVYITGGTVSDISVGGQSTGMTSGAFRVQANQTITLTYTVAPTWIWFGD